MIATLPRTFPLDFVAPGDGDDDKDYVEDNEIEFTGTRGKFLRLSAYIDIDSRITIGCAGAALTYIGRRKAVGFPRRSADESPAFRVSSLDMFSLGDVMYVR